MPLVQFFTLHEHKLVLFESNPNFIHIKLHLFCTISTWHSYWESRCIWGLFNIFAESIHWHCNAECACVRWTITLYSRRLHKHIKKYSDSFVSIAIKTIQNDFNFEKCLQLGQATAMFKFSWSIILVLIHDIHWFYIEIFSIGE